MRLEYGWRDGKLILEAEPLTAYEVAALEEITECAFHEMAERTRGGSGDDQFYVDDAYKQMKANKNYAILVEVVYRLLKQKGEIIKR